jgi:hypothetical protein
MNVNSAVSLSLVQYRTATDKRCLFLDSANI